MSALNASTAAADSSALLRDPVCGTLVRTTTPIALALAAAFFAQVGQTWLIGLLGPALLAAAGFVLPVTLTVSSFGLGLAAGATSVAARCLGAREPGVGELSRHILRLGALLGLGVGVAGWAATEPLLAALGAEGAALRLATRYLAISFAAAPAFLLGMASLALLRAAGDMRFVGGALATQAALALLLSWPLAFDVPRLAPAGLGFAGVAVAVGLSWCILSALAILRLHRIGLLAGGRGRRFRTTSWQVLRVGLPAGAANAVVAIGTGAVVAMLASVGTAEVAAFGIGLRVEVVALTPLLALATVTNPFAGQNGGAGRTDRLREALRLALLFCAAYGLACAAALTPAAGAVARLFSGDAAIAAAVALYLAVASWGFAALGAVAVVGAAFNGLQAPIPNLALSVLRCCVLGIPAAWLGLQWAGVAGAFAGLAASNLLAGAAAGWAFRRVRPDRATLRPGG